MFYYALFRLDVFIVTVNTEAVGELVKVDITLWYTATQSLQYHTGTLHQCKKQNVLYFQILFMKKQNLGMIKNLSGILLKMKALCILCGIRYPHNKSYAEEP